MSRRFPTMCGGFLFVRIVIDMKDCFGYNTHMNKQQDTYDFVKLDGIISKSPKDDIITLSVHDYRKLQDSMKELQTKVEAYKDLYRKLMIEKDLLLSIVKGGQSR